VVAIVLGIVVLRESVTPTVLAGIALVLAGVALTRHLDRKSTAAGDENGPGQYVEGIAEHQSAGDGAPAGSR
jgi:hypothetical protein